MIRDLTQQDYPAVRALAAESGLFDDAGLALIDATLEEHALDPSGALWLLAGHEAPLGVAYCVPEAMTEGTWNLLMLLVSPASHGQGYGRALVGRIEDDLRARGARLLIIETSGTDDFAGTRKFYARCGYEEEARLRDFYTAGDDKVVFTKAL